MIPLSFEERRAILRLCSESSVAQDLLGTAFRMPDDWYVPHADSSDPYESRVVALAGKLKAYLVAMAAEVEEYGPGPETDRLRSEAVGICLALRELHLMFPEVLSGPSKPGDSHG